MVNIIIKSRGKKKKKERKKLVLKFIKKVDICFFIVMIFLNKIKCKEIFYFDCL